LSNQSSLYEALHRHFGFTGFREGQAEVVESVLAGHDSVVVMPTGGGKSLCYQLPAMMRDGLTLVVSPLIALMKDQVDQLSAKGAPTTFINSSLGYRETNQRLSGLRRGQYKLVYVAPERFRSPMFTSSIEALGVSLVAVDEAHCISHWGHDFRPDYLRLRQAIEGLGRPQTIALTATATPQVRADIREQLGLRDPDVFVAGFDRPNLSLQVRHTSSEKEKLEILKHVLVTSQGSGIIYAATRKAVEQITAKLKMSGLRVEGYHAGMTETERTRAQDSFMRGKAQAIVATNAFGMGIDKPDTRFVVHYHFPDSVEAYYQEIGRAGRDGLPAICLLLFNYADLRTHQFFIEANHPTPELIRRVYDQLVSYGVPTVETTAAELARALGVKNAMSVSSALVILERAGHIDRGRAADSTLMAWLKMRIDEALDAVEENSTDSVVLRDLIFQRDLSEGEQVEIDVSRLASSLSLKDWQIRRALDGLTSRGVLAYRKAFRGHGIRLVDDAPAEDLRINKRELVQRAAAEQLKLRRMLDFCYHKGCLRRFVLSYFGDRKRIERCGSCSTCEPASAARTAPAFRIKRSEKGAGTLSIAIGASAPFPEATGIDHFIIDNAPSGDELRANLKRRSEANRAESNRPDTSDDVTRQARRQSEPGQNGDPRPLNDEQLLVVRKILSCVARMNGRFGKGTVAAVLRGSKSRQIADNSLDKLSTYGLLQALSQDEITAYIKSLIDAGCVEVSKGLYPTISLTEFGRDVMHERARVMLSFLDALRN
jgi:ATP-dependent DNA helicase RecQ